VSASPYPLRLPDAVDQAARIAANDQGRSLNGQLSWYVRDGLRRDGYMVAPTDAPSDPHKEQGQ